MIFLTGPHGAGKTTASRMLGQYGFQAIDLGPTIRRLHLEADQELPFQDWCMAGERRIGKHFTDQILVEELNRQFCLCEEKDSFLDLLVVGSRSFAGIEFLKTHVRCRSAYHDVVIFLDANEETLRRNFNEREGTIYTKEGFAKVLERDTQMGIDSIRQAADYVIRNEGSLGKLEASIQALIFGTLKYRKKA